LRCRDATEVIAVGAQHFRELARLRAPHKLNSVAVPAVRGSLTKDAFSTSRMAAGGHVPLEHIKVAVHFHRKKSSRFCVGASSGEPANLDKLKAPGSEEGLRCSISRNFVRRRREPAPPAQSLMTPAP
jgi:hypothetical protein